MQYESENGKVRIEDSNLTDMAAKDFKVDPVQMEHLNTDPVEPSEPMLEKVPEEKHDDSKPDESAQPSPEKEPANAEENAANPEAQEA